MWIPSPLRLRVNAYALKGCPDPLAATCPADSPTYCPCPDFAISSYGPLLADDRRNYSSPPAKGPALEAVLPILVSENVHRRRLLLLLLLLLYLVGPAAGDFRHQTSRVPVVGLHCLRRAFPRKLILLRRQSVVLLLSVQGLGVLPNIALLRYLVIFVAFRLQAPHFGFGAMDVKPCLCGLWSTLLQSEGERKELMGKGVASKSISAQMVELGLRLQMLATFPRERKEKKPVQEVD